MNDEVTALRLYRSEERGLLVAAAASFRWACNGDIAAVESDARLGLWEAAVRYDEKRAEATFRTYAEHRVFGACLDGLRDRGWVPRSLWAKGERRNVESLDRVVRDDEGTETQRLSDRIPDQRAADDLDAADAAADVARALTALDTRHRYVIEMHDLHGYTLTHIGELLGVSESRVCQMRGKALAVMYHAARRWTPAA